jgi:hypothetical protein
LLRVGQSSTEVTVKEEHPPAPKRRPVHLQTIALAVVAAGVIAAMALLNRSAAPVAHDSDHAPQLQEQAADVGPSPQPIEAAAAPSRPKTSSAQNRVTNHVPESAKSAAVVTAAPARHVPDEEDWVVKQIRSDVKRVADAATSMSATEGKPSSVTIMGCLETSTSGDEYRLTDTEGADAPKSRGWRTGFLKERTVPVALVEAPDRVPLESSVGKRVAATGLLASRELRVSALRVVDASCD